MPWIAILSGLTEGQQRKEHGMKRADYSRKGKHLTREEMDNKPLSGGV